MHLEVVCDGLSEVQKSVTGPKLIFFVIFGHFFLLVSLELMRMANTASKNFRRRQIVSMGPKRLFPGN